MLVVWNLRAGIAQSVWRRAMGWTAGVRYHEGERDFSLLQRPYQLWGPPNLVSNAYRGLFPRG
jgi:hypothetical protein